MAVLFRLLYTGTCCCTQRSMPAGICLVMNAAATLTPEVAVVFVSRSLVNRSVGELKSRILHVSHALACRLPSLLLTYDSKLQLFLGPPVQSCSHLRLTVFLLLLAHTFQGKREESASQHSGWSGSVSRWHTGSTHFLQRTFQVLCFRQLHPEPDSRTPMPIPRLKLLI